MANIVRSPREATNAFGSQPKQRNLFVVRFVPNVPQTDPKLLTSLTFIAKSAERPKINTKIEELHQYNKKRQVYTGFKLEPVRFQFYDDAKSSALRMWQNYVSYYFGDFTGVLTSSSSVRPYAYDVISAQMQSMNFGFTASATDGNGDFYFDHIELYHFYDKVYDVYQLINPRIMSFDPDEMDYSSSEIAMISMQVAYENLQFAFNQDTSRGDVNGEPFLEFTTGATFDGNVIPIADLAKQPATTLPLSSPGSSSMSVEQVLTSALGAVTGAISAGYRYVSTPSTGSLGQYGNYQYGPTVQQSLTALAQTNPALATSLDMGANTDPLALTQASLQGAANTLASRGVNGAQLDVAMAQATAATDNGQVQTTDFQGTPTTNGQSATTNLLAKSILASNALSYIGTSDSNFSSTNVVISGGGGSINGGSSVLNGGAGNTSGSANNRSIITPNGVALTAQGYGVINTQQTGTSQYGFNNNATPSGSSSGYTGAAGYQGPVGQENNGPFSGDLPNGLYGRYGITVEPLGPIAIPANPVTVAI